MSPVHEDKLCILEQPLETIPRDVSPDIIDTLKWSSKKCSSNPQEGKAKKAEKWTAEISKQKISQ